ncbi:MAG: hypothetical protein JW951_08655, partial [Lentisphaerae bacterium]|nr:hypothetical protein [Lentisphaerota bacterium]
MKRRQEGMMTRRWAWRVTMAAACGCILALGWARTAAAQRRAGDAGEARRGERVLSLEKFEAVGRRNRVKTPEYETNINRGPGLPREWARVAVEYSTYPEWVDTLTFQYWVMALREEDGENAYSLYTKTVRYVDIRQGREHMSTVFLHPTALERYGEVVAAAVEVSHEGRMIESASEADIPVPERWWRNAQVVENQAVTA